MLAGALCYHCEFKHSNSIYSINMFVKLAVLACVAAVAFGQHWGGGNHGGWNGGQNSLDSGAYTGDGDYHGEGLQEAGAFGDVSQNWNDNQGGQQWNGGDNNGQWNGDQGNNWNNGNNGQWNDGNNGQWNGGNDGQWNGAHNNGGHNNGGWNGGNNGQWNNGGNNGGWNGGHAAAQPGLLPAGVDASACPNYPYCH